MNNWKHILTLVFIIKWFNSVDQLVLALNRLTEAQQKTAQVIAVPSDRNEGSIFFGKVGGLMGKPYGLLYNKDAK